MVRKACGGLGSKGTKNAEDTSDCEHRVSKKGGRKEQKAGLDRKCEDGLWKEYVNGAQWEVLLVVVSDLV
jgi:hypothetical protein